MRAQLILLAMIAFALASAALSLGDAFSRYTHRTTNSVGIPDAGTGRLRAAVPKGERLGFFSDRSDSEAADRRMRAAVYSLAPLLVENTPKRPFVIGDFQNEAGIPVSLSGHRLRAVADLGNGFWLLAAAQR